MTLLIDLNGDAESRLRRAATLQGVQPEVYAKQIIENHLPPVEIGEQDHATLTLLAQWDAEDATGDPNEIDYRQKELNDYKQAINANRSQSEGPNSRTIFP